MNFDLVSLWEPRAGRGFSIRPQQPRVAAVGSGPRRTHSDRSTMVRAPRFSNDWLLRAKRRQAVANGFGRCRLVTLQMKDQRWEKQFGSAGAPGYRSRVAARFHVSFNQGVTILLSGSTKLGHRKVLEEVVWRFFRQRDG